MSGRARMRDGFNVLETELTAQIIDEIVENPAVTYLEISRKFNVQPHALHYIKAKYRKEITRRLDNKADLPPENIDKYEIACMLWDAVKEIEALKKRVHDLEQER